MQFSIEAMGLVISWLVATMVLVYRIGAIIANLQQISEDLKSLTAQVKDHIASTSTRLSQLETRMVTAEILLGGGSGIEGRRTWRPPGSD